MIKTEKKWLVAASLTSLLSGQVPYFYQALYHNLLETPLTSTLSGFVFAFLFIFPILAILFLFKSVSIARLAAFLVISLWFYKLYHFYSPGLTSNVVRIALFVSAIAIFFVFNKFLDDKCWVKFYKMITFGTALWALAIPISAVFQRSIHDEITTTLSINKLFDIPPKAVVFIVFDEFSPESMEPLVSILTADNHSLHATTVGKAGGSTIYALPSMLTNQQHKDVIACGSSQLCGSTSFVMDKLIARNPNTDVVGFFHPYCKIKGLRSCYVFNAESEIKGYSHIHSLLNGVIRRIPVLGNAPGDIGDDKYNLFKSMRIDLADKLYRTPFWDQAGGLLFIHYPSPHPDGGNTKSNLSEEYNSNIIELSKFVSVLIKRLRSSFGDDYAVVITSDHPLRTSSIWCKSPIYSSVQCNAENPVESDLVPFLVLAPNQTQVRLPKSNYGILAPN